MCKNADILIVEDSDNDFFFIERSVQGLKHVGAYHRAKNGQEAIEYLTSDLDKLPSLIVMDVNMPIMDGYTCLTALKKITEIRSIPVLIFSTLNTETSAKNSLNRYAASHLVKPRTLKEYSELFASVEKYWFETALTPIEK